MGISERSFNHGRRTRMVEHLMPLALADDPEAGIRFEPVNIASVTRSA
jgi:hypothetical protein